MYGRFLSPDPARDQHFEQTQSWNIYSYVQNDPTMRIDPTGEFGLLGDLASAYYDQQLDAGAFILSHAHYIPVFGSAVQAGRNLGEAIEGQRVNENGTTSDLSLAARGDSARNGTVGMAPLVIGGGAQLAAPTLTAALPGVQQGANGTLQVVTATATAQTGNVVGALAAPALAAANGGSGASGASGEKKVEYKNTVSGKSGKEAANNAPSWAKGQRPTTSENGKQFAERLMKNKYGNDWQKRGTGAGSEYNQIKKWGDRGFQ
jgi:hypothetical protein